MDYFILFCLDLCKRSIDYSVHQLLAARIYGIILGYEDVNDYDKLHHDPALAIALKKLNFIDSNQVGLAGQSTINRLEYCPETIIEPEKSRYHKIEHNPKEIEKALVDIFLESGSSLLFMLNQQTRCQDNILLTQKF